MTRIRLPFKFLCIEGRASVLNKRTEFGTNASSHLFENPKSAVSVHTQFSQAVPLSACKQ
jgi:hypothetical protein